MFLHCVQKQSKSSLQLVVSENTVLLHWHLEEPLFCCFISYTSTCLVMVSVSYHSLPYLLALCTAALLLLILQACSYLKAFILSLLFCLEHPSFIFSWLVPLETLGLTQRPYLKLQSLLNNSLYLSFFLSFP